MKKREKFVAGLVLLAAVAGFIFFHILLPVLPVSMMTQTPENLLPVIIIDAGHGGQDGGAVSAAGVCEKNLNLAIAKQLAEFFTVSGYPVVLTREEDISLGDDSLPIRQQKQEDLKKRVEIANQYPGATLISIHLNAFPESKSVKGSQVFYPKGKEESRPLALATQAALLEVLDDGNHRVVKEHSSFYLFKKANTRSILVECGFLSNPGEAELLQDPEYQKKLAFSIYLSFLRDQMNPIQMEGPAEG